MSNLQTIGDVITSLRNIVQQCKAAKSRAGYFVALYLRMTQAVQTGIQKGMFEDGPRMEKLDIIFAKRYLDAYAAYQSRQTCSQSWQWAFDSGTNNNLIVLQQLVLGVNTHINLDLAIAAAETSPGNTINGLHNDFNRINAVISSLMDDVQQALEGVWPPMKLLQRIAGGRQDAVLNFSIGKARDTAWANATMLAQMNALQRQVYIEKLDGLVKEIGKRIANPGIMASVTLRLIRRSEFEDVARTIGLIENTVVEIQP